jgi:pilus assembly protein CpaF
MNKPTEPTVSLGPLDALLDDPEVVEIMVNGYNNVFVDRQTGGQLVMEEVPDLFHSEDELWTVIDALRELAEALGRRLDNTNPLVDIRLSDQARVNVVLPPISAYGPTITLRKFHRFGAFEAGDLVRFGSWNEDMVTFLRACVEARMNIIVAGNTGAGKTTVLNILTGMIPPTERVITVENALELNLPKTLKHVVRLESRPADHEGHGEVTIQDLIINAMRMRPDRIITGEVRSAEALDILQALNTGHDGSLFSIHASSPRDALNRLELMCTSHHITVPLLTVRHQIAEAINLITYQEKLQDGRRRIMKITEVTGMQGDLVALQDIFEFRQTGLDADGKVGGYFSATGKIPACIERFRALGLDVPMSIFTPR